MLRLGFHYHVPMYQDTRGDIKTSGYFGVFLDHLAVHCSKLVCFLHSPLAQETPYLDYTLRAANVQWVDIGPHSAFPLRVLRTRAISRVVTQSYHGIDALLIRGPSPLLPAVAGAVDGLPTALLLVADYLAGIDDIAQPRWIKEGIRLWARWNHYQQMKVAQRSLTFVNSFRLYDELSPFVQNLVETRTTTLTSGDLYKRKDTCTQQQIHLLYTGRIERSKGLWEILEALALLVESGEDLVLDLVGWPSKRDPNLEEIRTVAATKEVVNRVFYHGYKPVGPGLFEYYRQADIYVIASTSDSEGFPRTIWESMANSLPVVATRVGSIPFYLQDHETAMLVQPKDSQQLAGAIFEVIHDGELRQRLIHNGYVLASENTLEKRSNEMISLINGWCTKKRNGE